MQDRSWGDADHILFTLSHGAAVSGCALFYFCETSCTPEASWEGADSVFFPP